jgi:isopenicillin-N epimerase
MTASDSWVFREGITFLNHGSFGACPVPVLEKREQLLRQIELDPMQFMLSDYQPLLSSALEALTRFTGAEKDSLVFVENCTAGINTILHNISLKPGDGILVTDQEYFSSMNALKEIASRKGAVVQLIHLPLPVYSEEEILEAVAAAITPETRFALIDHIVSSTGMVVPLKK